MSNYLTTWYNIIDTRKKAGLAKILLLLLGISEVMFIPTANAQTTSSDSSNAAPNFSSGRFNEIEPIQQPGSFFDSGSGSQQFFQQDRQQLFFLPDRKSEPILQIDEETKKEQQLESKDKPNSWSVDR